tara:strand:+ start:5661 stop:10994 length:5334 start_codon:yes stop_codon:yes gene_type:complete
MGGIPNPIEIIKRPIEWIGDVIDDVSDWVVEEIVDPVVDAVDDVVAAVEDDPIKAIATVAAYATGNAWAIPIIEGVDVAQNGGDIGDILEASAKAYVAQQAGSYAGKYAGEAAVAAGSGQTAATILGTASGQAASAVVLGQDPAKAFLTGGLKAGIEAGLGYIDEKISSATGDGTGTGVAPGDAGGVGDPGPIGETQSFLEQYPTVKNILADSLQAALSGQDVTGEVVMGAVIKGKLTKELVQEYLTTEDFDPESASDQRYLAALTTTVQNVTNATFSGADVSDTLYASANAFGKQELLKIVDKEVKNTIDKVTGDYQKVEATAAELDKQNASYTKIAQSYNGYVAELQNRIGIRDGKLAEVNRLKDILQNTRIDTAADEPAYQVALDNYNAAVNDFNTYSNEVDTYYENRFKPDTAALQIQLDRKADEIATLTTQYDTEKNDLISTGDQLDDALVPVANAVQSAYVRAMTGDEFNAAEYKAVNKLGDISDDDARYHWLTTGKDENLPVSQAQYNMELDIALSSSMEGTLEALGLGIADLSPAQIKVLREQTLAYGNGDLQSLRDIENGSSLLATTFRDSIGKDLVEDPEVVPPEQLQNLLDAYEVSSYDELPDVEKVRITNSALKGQKDEVQAINKPDDVSDFDILTGKATVSTNAEGLLNWEDVSLKFNVPKWSSKHGTIVKQVPHPSPSVAGNTPLALVDMQGNYLNIGDDGRPLEIIQITGATNFSNLKNDNPGSYLDVLADATPEAVKEAVNAGVAGLQQQYEFAKNVATYIANTETAQNIANSDFGQNTAGVVLDAGGELLDSFNNLVLIAGINPESTPLGKTARDMMALAGDFKTTEYQEAAARIQDTISEANIEPDKLPNGSPNPKAGQLKTNPDGTPLSTFTKAWNTIQAIGGAALADPGVFASEYIAKEVLQEIPVLIASGGTANVVKASLKQAGEEFAQKMGQRTALGTAGVLDVSESFGGTAGSAYDDAFATALKSGMSDAEAQEYALDKAITAGTIAAVTTVGTMGVGGNAFEKAIFNGKRGKNFSEAFNVAVKEAGQEAVEEGLPQAYLESQLYQLDPTRDVVGNVVSNSVLGAISGGSTATSIYAGASTGDFLSNAIIAFNPNVREIVQNEGGLDAAGVTQQLNDLGVSDTTIQSNILNQVFDADYTSTGEAEQAAFDYVTNSNIPYKFTKDEITNFTGANPDAGLPDAFDAYVDPRYLDAQEIINAAAAEGVTLTQEQIQQYVGQTDEAAGVADIKTEYDPQGVIYSEAEQYLTDLGYNPTADEINQFVAQVNETEQQQAVSEYVDPRMTSTEEATEFLTALGYQPSEEEIAQFVGQYGEVAQQEAIEKYVDPRLVTEEEVLNAFKVAGLPDVRPEDIPGLVGQYDEAELVDKLEEALPGAQFNVLKYMLGKPPTSDTEATGIYKELENLIAAGATQDEAIQQISDRLNVSTQDLENAISEVSDEVADIETKLGDQIGDVETKLGDQIGDVETKLGDQIGGVETSLTDIINDVNTSLTDKITALQDAGLSQDQAIKEISTQLNLSVADIQSQLGDIESGIGEDISGLTSEVDAIAQIIGKPATEVNATDIDFIEDIIAQTEAFSDPTQFQFTQDQLAYDVTGDGIVDINDQNLLNNALQGQDVTFATESKFQPATGIFAQLDQQAALQQQQQADLQAQIQAQIDAQTQQQADQQMQLAQQVEDEATKTRRLSNVKDLQQMIMQDAGRITQVKSQPVAQIGPAYDFQSIFRNPAQQSFYQTPYAEGGIVETNEELLRLIGGK